MSWSALFGDTLIVKSENDASTTPVNTESHLAGKYVMIYFSAHWCPPCRGFTPSLATFYNNFKANGNIPFEIVFASSDKDQRTFDEYYGSMPWATIPFSERDIKATLSSKYKVSGIPCLVVLNTDGSLITTQGRGKVASDPTGASFPWLPETFQQELGNQFSTKSGTVDASSFAGKFLGLYFSAHWCPPCKAFTPKLVKYYNTRKEQGKDDFEVIFVTGDRAESDFQGYFAEMPWLAIPFGDPRLSKLNERFEVEGIPTLVILDHEGNVVNKSARSGVESDPNGTKFPYYPEPAEDLSQGVESFGTDLNSTATIIALMENADDDEQSDAKSVLISLGEIYAKAKANTPEGPEFIFFYSFAPSGISDQIRMLCKLKPVAQSTSPQLVLLNIPDNGGFYVSDATEVTTETVEALINGFKNKTLERKQMSRG